MYGSFRASAPQYYNTVGYNIEKAGGEYQEEIFEDRLRWKLKAGSPGKNAGADGTDMGIYGGAGAKDLRIPAYPQVTEFTVGGTSTADGNLQVKVKVEAQEK